MMAEVLPMACRSLQLYQAASRLTLLGLHIKSL